VPKNIDTATGDPFFPGVEVVAAPPEAKLQFPESCRQYALSQSATYAAWCWLTNGVCLLIPRDFLGYKGNGKSNALIGCLNPGEKLEWACSTSQRTRYVVEFTDAAKKDEAARKSIVSQINLLGGVLRHTGDIFLIVGELLPFSFLQTLDI
jgi:hypothetical protein